MKPRMIGVRSAVLLAAVLLCLPVQAATPVSQSALLAALVRNHYLPHSDAFAQAAPRLTRALSALCASRDPGAVEAARSAWTETLLAWERTNAVAVGPLLNRRSIYRVDFWWEPLIMHEVFKRELPLDLTGLDYVGGPAKGLPTIEWLLWSFDARQLAQNSGGKCSYAVLAAEAVAREAETLHREFAALAAREPDAQEAADRFREFLNQSLGSLVQLAFRKMERPLMPRQVFPREPSRQTKASWDAQWTTVRTLLVGAKGAGTISLRDYLLSRKLKAPAGRLTAGCDRVTAALARATPDNRDSVRETIEALKGLQNVLRNDVADALDVSIDFLETDGD